MTIQDFDHKRSRTLGRTLPPFSVYNLGFKRLFDIFAVLLSLPFVLPLIAISALLVARDGGSPFYCQPRIGRNGRTYTIWKLRTMVFDAEAKLEAHLRNNPRAAREWEINQKLQNDPRITRMGELLRKSSMDELPQLWNVLIGDMSLVGPRPMMPAQQSMYPGTAYFSQRPGITGSWQVSVRNGSTFAERARFDTDYVAKLSFVNDVKILFATIGVVARGTGC